MASRKTARPAASKAAGTRAAGKATATARKAPARKPVPQPADKGTQAKAKATAQATAKAKAGTQAKAAMLRAYRPTLPGYAAFPNDAAKSAFTLAALIVSGMATMTKEGTLSRKTGGKPSLFRAIVGAGMINYHRKLGRFDADGYLTSEGAVWFHNRKGDSAPAYRTTADLVRSMVPAIQKKGTVEVTHNTGTRKIAFDAEVAVSK